MSDNPISGRRETRESLSDPCGVKEATVRAIVAEYDFSKLGGAVGTIYLDKVVPPGAMVLAGNLYVITALTSDGGAEVGVDLEASDDIIANTVIAGAPWSTTGEKNVVPDGTGSAAVRATDYRQVAIVITVAALTAGKFVVTLLYVAEE